MVQKFTMPAGRYYVGDLCYVLDDRQNGDDTWNEVCNLTFDEDGRSKKGTFVLKDGRKFAMFSTAYGDGGYDCVPLYKELSVDSGTIGCVLLSDIKKVDEKEMERLGAVVDFDKDFQVYEDAGLITIGHLSIDTDPEPEEEICSSCGEEVQECSCDESEFDPFED